jgi:gliding motility-associated-like protein
LIFARPNAMKYICKIIRVRLSTVYLILLAAWTNVSGQKPLNDSCHNATPITFGIDNFDVGIFESDSTVLDSASIQTGEWFHSSLIASGNDKKSVWYKFYLPARRGVEIELRQSAGGIDIRDVGFTTYFSPNCLPNSTDATNAKITTINQIGSSSHPCLDPGWYLIQVSSKSAVKGEIFMRIKTSFPYQQFNVNSAVYDVCSTAYDFQDLVIGRQGWQTQSIDFQLGCYSIKDSSEYFKNIGNNFHRYTQLAWFKFKSFGFSDLAHIKLNQIGGTNLDITDTFAYRLYEGDCNSSLTLVDSGYSNFSRTNRCGSDSTSDWANFYKCYFDSGKVYTLQLIFHNNLEKNLRLTLADRTSEFDKKNNHPVASVANNLGLISNNGSTNFGFSCASKIDSNLCNSNSMTKDIMVVNSPYTYNLNHWVYFSLSNYSRFIFDISSLNNAIRVNNLSFRIFKDSISNNCSSVDTNNIIFERYGSSSVIINCLEPGHYAIQLLGTDSALTNCEGPAHIGGDFRLNWIYSRQPQRSKFSLELTGEVDTINNRNLLTKNTNYNLSRDTISCNDAPLPLRSCNSKYRKAIYRTFEITDSGMIRLSNFLNFTNYQNQYEYAFSKIYKGDALSLSLNQNISSAQDTLKDLNPWGKCFNSNNNYCLEPGKYTIVTFADVPFIGIVETPRLQYEVSTTKFNTYQNASFIDTIRNNLTYYSEYDTFSCSVNPDTIDGVYCGKRNIFYTFYLDSISTFSLSLEDWGSHQSFSLFHGNIKDGKTDLKAVNQSDNIIWKCQSTDNSVVTSECKPLTPGWYTVMVSNKNEIEYDSSLTDMTFNSRLYSNNGAGRVKIVTQTPSAIPRKYYKPYKAAFVDSLINNLKPLAHDTNYSTRSGMAQHKARFLLPQEVIECGLDSTFHNFPDSLLCMNNTTDIVYYVFNLSKPSYAYINGGTTGGTLKMKMYDFDVRKDSSLILTKEPIQDCNYDGRFIEFCNLQPGVYTLVYFLNRTNDERVVISPIITLDTVLTSRFDHAKNAYDFGRIPGDGSWYVGKIGDSHPVDTTLPPSHDVITCKTGSQPNHPVLGDCFQEFNPYIYGSEVNTPSFPYDSAFYKFRGKDYFNYGIVAPLRNVWYSFTIRGRGEVTVSLEGLSEKFISAPLVGLRWAVYETNSNGDLDLSTLIANGQFDSTSNGLKFIGNSNPGWCRGISQNVTFNISTCEPIKTRRYIIVVYTNNNYANLNGNYHLWPRIKYDSSFLQDTKFDYYSNANLIDGLTEKNLVINYGAEQNLSSWNVQNNATTSNAFASSIQRSFFGNGYNNTNQISSIAQNIDVSDYTTHIQNRQVQMNLSFNYLTQKFPNRNIDEVRALVYYLDGNGLYIDSFETNWLKNDEIWSHFKDQQTVPSNTKNLKLILQFKKNNNDPSWGYRFQYAYAYVDDINLTLKINTIPSQRPLLSSKKLYQGELSYFASSTLDSTDIGKLHNNSNCNGDQAGTIWYKFKIDSTGYLHYNMLYSYIRQNETFQAHTINNQYIRLYKSIIDGDSLYGLEYTPFATSSSEFSSMLGSSAAKVCVSPGFYYLQINRCGLIRCEDFVVPQIVLDYARGDYCTTAEPIIIDSSERKSASLLVNCHTIGESFGEDGTDMGCLFGPDGYKSSWFVIDYKDTATVNLEFRLAENTTANSRQIRYRTFYGNCQTLTAAPCNNNALTAFTIDCIRKGTYYVQVVTPENAIGDISLSVEAKKNIDTTCSPVDIFQPVADFSYNISCPENMVNFTNFSTKGDSISYLWDFGFNGLTDTTINPTIVFPASSIETNYDVKLVVSHKERPYVDSLSININIPAAPSLFIQNNDTNLCLGQSVTLTALLSDGIGYWNTLDTSKSITVSKTDWYFFKQIQKPNILSNGSGEFSLFNNGWTQTSGTWERRSSNPMPLDSQYYISSNHVNNRNAGIYEIRQEINVSSDSISIDSGLAKTSFIGYVLCGNETIIDEGQVVLEYRDNLGNLLASYRSDFISESSDWVELVHSRTTPIGTRKLVLRLKAANRINNTQCMVYFDKLQVKMQSACEYMDSVYVQINPIPELSLPTDTLICPNSELSLGPVYLDYENPYFLFDLFDGSSSSATFRNNAFYVPNNQYVNLTDNMASNSSGAIEWQNNALLINDTFEVDFEIFTKRNSAGYNGEATYFYLFNSQAPISDNQSGTNGYVISFNERDNNSISIYWNGNMLHKVYPGLNFINGIWNKIQLKYSNQTFNIDFNNKRVVTFTDTIIRTQLGFLYGIGAFNSSTFFGEHRARNIMVSKNNDERVIITPPLERNYTYHWSDGNLNPIRQINQPGKYNLYITDGFGCSSNLDSIEIDVYPMGEKVLTDTPVVCNQLDSFLYLTNDSFGFFIKMNIIDSLGWINIANSQIGLNEVIFSFMNENNCPQLDTGYYDKINAKELLIQPIGTLCLNDKVVQIQVNDSSGYFYGGVFVDSSGVFNPSLASIGVNKVFYRNLDLICESIDSIDIFVNTIPNASIQAAGPYCANQETQLITPVLSGGYFNPTLFIDSLGNFDPRISGAGDYEVYYEITDGNGCWNRDSLIIRVDTIPNASIQAAGPYCANQETQLITPILSGGHFNPTLFIDSLGNFDPRISGAGDYEVYYEITDGNGCWNRDSLIIRVDTIPNASIQAAGPYCANQETQLITPVLSGGYFNPTLFIDSLGNFDPRISGAGDYEVYYEITDGNGCWNRDSLIIRVDTIPNASIQAAGPYCANQETQLITPVLSGGYFNPTLFIDSLGNFDPRISGAGNYEVYYEITDGNGCWNRDSLIIRVDTIPNASIQAAGPYCANQETQLITPVLSGGYFNPTLFIDSLGNFDPRISGAGNYEVYYEITDGNGCWNRDSLIIRVDTIPNASIQAAGPYCANQETQLITPVLSGGYFNPTLFIDSLGNFDPRISGAGDYEVYYEITDGNGCWNRDSLIIRVDTIPNASIQAAGPYCANQETQLITPVLSGGYFNPTLFIDSLGNFDPRISGAGDYEVYYEITDGNGCWNRDSLIIRVDTIPNASIQAAGPYCANQETQLITPVLSGGYFNPTLFIDSLGNFDPRISGAGDYEVYYEITDGNGCWNRDSLIIRVDTIPNASIQAAGPYCANQETQLITPVLSGGYFNPTLFIDSLGNFDPRISGAGDYEVYYEITDGNGCWNRDSLIIRVDTIPNASIQAAGPYCANQETQLITPVLSGGYFNPTLFIDSLGNFDPRISGAGNYEVYYEITDGNGCWNRDSLIIRVDTIPNASIQAAGPYCANQETQLITPILSGGHFNPTLFIDSLGNFDPRISGAGDYEVYYEITDGNGCWNRDSLIIRVDTIPNASIQAAGPYCINEGTKIIKPILDGGYFITTAYLDSNGNFDPLISGAGSFDIYYEITDERGCWNFDSIQITIYDYIDATIKPVEDICENEDAIQIEVVNNNGVFLPKNYLNTSGIFNPTLAGPGIHSIVYSITNQWNCNDIDTINVLVNPKPNNQILVLPKLGCAPLGTRISTDSKNRVYWEINDTFLGQFYDTTLLLKEGTYKLHFRAVNEFNCQIEILENLQSLPSPTADFISNKDSAFLGEAKIIFTDKSTGNIVEREWYFGDGGFSNETNPTREYLDTGVFEVELFVINNVGCRHNATGIIVIEHTFSLFIPNAFTPGGDGLNEVFRPLGNKIHSVSCKIFNRWGEMLIDEDNFKGWDGTYKDEPVQDGVYLYIMTVRDMQGNTHNKSGQVHVLR